MFAFVKLFALSALTLGSFATPAKPVVKSDCCAQGLACCTPPSACCPADCCPGAARCQAP